MRIIITENKLVNLINKTLGDKFSPNIQMITNYYDANILIRRMFDDKEEFNNLLNHWGPMYFIKTPECGDWLAQQRKNREWFIFKNGHMIIDGVEVLIIDEYKLLSCMGLSMLGIPLQTIIDNFAYEY